MYQDWTISLDDLTAAHSSGLVIRRVHDGYGQHPYWKIIDGNATDSLIKEGVACFDHDFAKEILGYYLSESDFTLDEIVSIARKFEVDKNIDKKISKEKLVSYLEDKEFFPIDEISTIRSAVYFYRSDRTPDKNRES